MADPRLFTPFALRGLTLPNRVVVSPMCQYSAEGGSANDWHLMHYGHLSLGGFGLLIFEASAVEPRGRITHVCLGLFSDDNERALARVIAACRRYGNTPLGAQLAHAGVKASHRTKWDGAGYLRPDEDPWTTVAPSPVPITDGAPAPVALNRDDIRATVAHFVAATRRAERLGFDMIEIHGAHGYLVHEFLSPIYNRRDDEYGGSRGNRMRFALELFAAVRAAWPADKPLGMRISATDHVEGGWDVADSVVLARELKALGCDYIDASSGGISAKQKITLGRGYQVPYAARIRGEVGMPTMAVGMINDPAQAEDIVASGQADLVAIARGVLYDPRWPWHAAEALGGRAAYPIQYERCRPDMWPEAFA